MIPLGILASLVAVIDPPQTGYGYYAGSNNDISSIDRVDVSNDTISTIAPTLVVGRRGSSGTQNATYARAYISGGYSAGETPPYLYSIEKMAFGTQAVTDTGNSLSPNRTGTASYTGVNYAHVCGGYATTYYAIVTDRINFANDVRAAGDHSISPGRSSLTAWESTTYGYVAGGANGTEDWTVEKFLHTTYARTYIGDMSLGAYGPGGCRSTTHGYIASGGSVKYWEKWSFSGDVKTVLSSALMATIGGGRAAFESQNAGYTSGGSTFNDNKVERIRFQNDTCETLANVLSAYRTYPAGFQNAIA